MHKLTKDEANRIVWNDNKDWRIVNDVESTEPHKQMYSCIAVFEHKPSSKFYEFEWTVLTDEWGCDPFEYHESEYVEPIEMKLQEIVVKEWVAV